MNIYMWSGPRNLSTALMRSFENRLDTIVWDEPLYAYYLKETNKNHPLKNEIIEYYETNIIKLISLISKEKLNKKIFYQKHMTHHILNDTPLDWINKGMNCFLIRNPKDVMLSYIKKNDIKNIDDIGFPMQYKLFKLVKETGSKPIIINADDLSSSPELALKKLCKSLKIEFTKKMLNWPKGNRITDGIWEKIWYKDVKSSSSFHKLNNNNSEIPENYNSIYQESLEIYNEINSYAELNGD